MLGLMSLWMWLSRVPGSPGSSCTLQSSSPAGAWHSEGQKEERHSQGEQESLGVLHPCTASLSPTPRGLQAQVGAQRQSAGLTAPCWKSPLLGPQPSLWILQSQISKTVYNLYKFHDLHLRASKRVNKETLLGSVTSCGTVLRDKKGSFTCQHWQILCIRKCNTTELKESHRMGKRWWHIQ